MNSIRTRDSAQQCAVSALYGCGGHCPVSYWRFPEMPTDPASFSPPRVLLVDDEPDQVEMYQYSLQSAGFVVTVAYNGRDAIARALEWQPHVVVLDVRLPDMSGWDVCRSLKAERETLACAVVILTAAASPVLAREAAAAGCAAHLVKPCYPDQLTDTVRGVLAHA